MFHLNMSSSMEWTAMPGIGLASISAYSYRGIVRFAGVISWSGEGDKYAMDSLLGGHLLLLGCANKL